MSTRAAAGVDHEAVQRRTVRTLVVSQAIGAVGVTIGVATASLLARDISGSETMAGLAQTFQVLGTAGAAYGLAKVMRRRGRRIGIVLGYLMGATGALLAVVAGVVDSMLVLLTGAVLLGATSAVNSGSRYAATDLATEEHRARALSVVVWATTIGAVAGPNLTGVGGALARSLGIPELTGGFAIGAVVLVVAAGWVWVMLRPDPLLLAQESAGIAPSVGPEPRGRSWGRFVSVVRDVPAVGAAVVAMACAHAAMVTVMIMTPLHMEHGGAHLEVIGFVISIHVLGMFAFSPLVGWAADRFGRSAVLVTGGAVLLVSLALCGWSPEGSSWQIFSGLFLLGLGWSCATVAASTVIADRTPIEARTDVQGTSDMAMALTAAGGGALAGVIVGGLGYPALAAFAALLAGAVVVAGRLMRPRS
ncbi:Predicted arabinose efflux permease, MFS family [Nocardioides alpinus]|uniref:MFS transporter n=1 Tax=Nocardioides alpinus TaxID=748909 RepID=A0A1I1BBM3_9ACTN|nr:MFS transporter [Nocardioides alpinus]PKH41310.1 MFS transporter [Nocardioides alpinus]SFB45940.1 Predicted arabinose efflux permease, MFS family [Nocardioides alpinus]